MERAICETSRLWVSRVDEDLGLVLQSTERGGMDDAVAVALEVAAVAAVRLPVQTPPAAPGPTRPGRQTLFSDHGDNVADAAGVGQRRWPAAGRGQRSFDKRLTRIT
jgi:hypothetical protein